MSDIRSECRPASIGICNIFPGYPFDEMAAAWQRGFDPALHIPPSRGDIIVGNDVWIGNGATILPGIRVGNGAIIIPALQRIAWWDWPVEKITRNIDLIRSTDLAALATTT